MTLSEIKQAVLAGKVVRWRNGAYEVIRDGVGQWFILCCLNGSLSSLTWSDGVTMSEKPEDFFVEEGGAR